VVLTQTTGLLNHLKPLLCYVMLCYVKRLRDVTTEMKQWRRLVKTVARAQESTAQGT